MSWISISRALPVLPDRDMGYPRSEPLMVYRKSGSQCVARYVRVDDEDPSSMGSWRSECSEAWDISAEVTHWRPCFEAPADGTPNEPLVGFFMEPEQLDQLRLIGNGLYGDGSSLTSDRRRDLANSLAVLIGRLKDQPVEV